MTQTNRDDHKAEDLLTATAEVKALIEKTEVAETHSFCNQQKSPRVALDRRTHYYLKDKATGLLVDAFYIRIPILNSTKYRIAN